MRTAKVQTITAQSIFSPLSTKRLFFQIIASPTTSLNFNSKLPLIVFVMKLDHFPTDRKRAIHNMRIEIDVK
jgi:hypothetical protein